jgi:DNA topoisomerase IA
MNYRLYFGENQRRTSAGRVQSVSVRLIVEREREIQNLKLLQHILWWQSLLTKLESHLKPNCLKNFNTKRS